MRENIITLYDCGLMDGIACLQQKTWLTGPYPGAEPVDFILPSDFEVRKSFHGTFIVEKESDEISPLTASLDGRPMIHSADRRTQYVLELA